MISPAVLLLSLTVAQSLEAGPGSLGLLIRDDGTLSSIEPLRGAVLHARPEVRAAAARIINVTGTVDLAEALRGALAEETDQGAAREQMRALAFLGTAEDDARILAARRLGDPMRSEAMIVLARSRGGTAIDVYFNDARSWPISAARRASIFSLACRGEQRCFDASAARALEASDEGTWLAVLQAVRDPNQLPDATRIASALRGSGSASRSDTIRRLLRVYEGWPPPASPLLLEALEAGARTTAKKGADPEDLFDEELLARVLGREPVENSAWRQKLKSSERCRVVDLASNRWLERFLTAREKRAVAKAYKRAYHGAEPFRYVPSSTRTGRQFTGMAVPPGFASSLLADTRCEPGEPAVVFGRISYDAHGRPQESSLDAPGASASCRRAAGILLRVSLMSGTEPAVPGAMQETMMILDRDLVLSIEEQTGTEAGWIGSTPEGEIRPPERVKFVKPDYPESVRLERVEGRVIMEVVVDRAGVPESIRVLRGDDRRLIASAVRSVSRWRYKPATLNGDPVKVYLTVIVEFNLK